MGAELRIESLYDEGWKTYGEAHHQAVADRDHLHADIRDRLGPKVAAEVERHVDVALGRLLAADLPALDTAAERAFHQLLALERAVMEIESTIESKSTFWDPYNLNGLFPMSWWQDVVPLLDGGGTPGFMRPKAVRRFWAKVVAADQRLPSGDKGGEMAEQFRQRWRELIEFLERAIRAKEPVWCDL